MTFATLSPYLAVAAALLAPFIAFYSGVSAGVRKERIRLTGNSLPRYENPPAPPVNEKLIKLLKKRYCWMIGCNQEAIWKVQDGKDFIHCCTDHMHVWMDRLQGKPYKITRIRDGHELKKKGVPTMPNHPGMPELSRHAARGIKFRIWDRETASWYKPVFEAYKGSLYELLLTTEGELCRRSMDGFTHESQFPNRYVVQHFAGLTDKNGKEIYEGDIVKDRFGRIMEVKRWNYRLCWVAITDTNFHHADLFDWVDQDEEGNKNGIARVEVIGNRYENPELLHHPQTESK